MMADCMSSSPELLGEFSLIQDDAAVKKLRLKLSGVVGPIHKVSVDNSLSTLEQHTHVVACAHDIFERARSDHVTFKDEDGDVVRIADCGPKQLLEVSFESSAGHSVVAVSAVSEQERATTGDAPEAAAKALQAVWQSRDTQASNLQ